MNRPAIPCVIPLLIVLLLTFQGDVAHAADIWSRGFMTTPVTKTSDPNTIIGKVLVDGAKVVVTAFLDGQPCVWSMDASGDQDATAFCVPQSVTGTSIIVPGAGILMVGNATDRRDKASYAIRVDAAGRVMWARRFSAPHEVTLTSGAITSDGGFILGGSEDIRAALVRLNADGTTQWARTYDATGQDAVTAILSAGDGTFVVTGCAQERPWIASVGPDGAIKWNVNFFLQGCGYAIVPSRTGYVLAGTLRTPAFYYLVAAVSREGKVQWQRMARSSAHTRLNRAFSLPDGTTLLSAYTGLMEDPQAQQFLVMDDKGNIVWQRRVILPDDLSGADVALTADGSAVIMSFINLRILHVQRVPVDPRSAPACAMAERTALKFEPYERLATFPIDVRASVMSSASFAATTQPGSVKRGDDCPKPVAAGAATPATPRPTSPFESDWQAMEQAQLEILNTVRGHLKARRFTALEQIAANYRKSGNRFVNGYRYLTRFYDSFRLNRVLTEQEQLAAVREWQRQVPGSVAAAIALATTHYEIASQARGEGSANTVSESGQRVIDANLEAADAALRANPHAQQEDTYWRIRSQLAGMRCDNLEGVARSIINRGTKDWDVFRAPVPFLMPRWCGSTDALRRYAEQAADSTKTEWGDAMYAMVAADVMRFEEPDDFRKYDFSWVRAQRGFRDLTRIWTKPVTNYHRFARMAYLMGDRRIAAELFARPELAWFPAMGSVWTQREHGEAWRFATHPPANSHVTPRLESSPSAPRVVEHTASASSPRAAASSRAAPIPSTNLRRGPRPEPWAASDPVQWPALILRNEITLKDGTVHRDFNSFLVSTAEGTIAISALTPLDVLDDSGMPGFASRSAYPLSRLKENLKSWTMSAPAQTLTPLVVTSVVPMPKRDEWRFNRYVAANVTTVAKNLPVMPLTVVTDTVTAGDPVTVVGCRTVSVGCMQTAYPARVTELHGAESELTSVAVEFDEATDVMQLFGSPILNELGHVIAVVTTPRSSANPNGAASGAPVRHMLRLAGLTAS